MGRFRDQLSRRSEALGEIFVGNCKVAFPAFSIGVHGKIGNRLVAGRLTESGYFPRTQTLQEALRVRRSLAVTVAGSASGYAGIASSPRRAGRQLGLHALDEVWMQLSSASLRQASAPYGSLIDSRASWEQAKRILADELDTEHCFGNIVGESLSMQHSRIANFRGKSHDRFHRC